MRHARCAAPPSHSVSHSACASSPRASRPKPRHSSWWPNSATRVRATFSAGRRRCASYATESCRPAPTHLHLPRARPSADITAEFDRPLLEVRHTLPESGVTHARSQNLLPASNAPHSRKRIGVTKGRELDEGEVLGIGRRRGGVNGVVGVVFFSELGNPRRRYGDGHESGAQLHR